MTDKDRAELIKSKIESKNMALRADRKPLTSGDPYFDDIRPCTDAEVRSELSKICRDQTVLQGIINFRYPLLSKLCPFILKPVVRSYLTKRTDNIHTIAQFQDRVANFMEHTIAATTDGVDFIGFDKLEKGTGYLFISNHRDISLDPAFIDFALYKHGLDTVRIAIGDNLLKNQAATSLMRLNKSFIVQRSVESPREKLKALTKLSTYIGLSIHEGHSVWIAQREGRAKDGDDRTEVSVLKMFHLYGRQLKLSFKDYIAGLNIVPVAISYEYDPADLAKARELDEKARNNGVYRKGSMEDLLSIAGGIKGYKGRVTIHAGSPLKDGFETPEDLAAVIDRFIWEHYRMYPTALIAAGQSADVSAAEQAKFEQRLAQYPQELRARVLAMYAKPYENLQTLKKSSAD